MFSILIVNASSKHSRKMRHKSATLWIIWYRRQISLNKKQKEKKQNENRNNGNKRMHSEKEETRLLATRIHWKRYIEF